MDRQCLPYIQWLQPKSSNRNLLSAFFHMITITLISTSQVQLSWFQIIGGMCVPHLSLNTFFTFGYADYKSMRDEDYNVYHDTAYTCITPKIVNMMRIIILFCFMAIIFSLIGFFLDIIGPKNKTYDFIRRNALPSVCTLTWILAIVTLCFYIQSLLEDTLPVGYRDFEVEVNFEYGFFAIIAAGIMTMSGIITNLLCTYIPRGRDALDENLLENNWEDVETFNLPPPPPPYSAPPPPYTP